MFQRWPTKSFSRHRPRVVSFLYFFFAATAAASLSRRCIRIPVSFRHPISGRCPVFHGFLPRPAPPAPARLLAVPVSASRIRACIGLPVRAPSRRVVFFIRGSPTRREESDAAQSRSRMLRISRVKRFIGAPAEDLYIRAVGGGRQSYLLRAVSRRIIEIASAPVF